MIIAAFGAAAAATVQKTNLHIEGMTCGSCATAVKLVLKKTVGVVGSTVSYEEKRAVVTYDPAKTTPAKVAEAVAGALSYKVNVESATAQGLNTEPAASCSTPPA